MAVDHAREAMMLALMAGRRVEECSYRSDSHGDNLDLQCQLGTKLVPSDISLKGISYKSIRHVIYVTQRRKPTNISLPTTILHNTIPQFFRIRHSSFILLTNFVGPEAFKHHN